MMRNFLLLFIVHTLLSACNNNKVWEKEINDGWKFMEVVLDSISVPQFPNREFLVTDFGAKSNDSLCTDAINEAILACNKAGGGKVVVPKGNYLTGAIKLLSNVNLHLEKDAVLMFSTNPSDYLPIVKTRFEGSELYNYSPLIYAFQQQNIAITGEGVLDGQASAKNWWAWEMCKKKDMEKGKPSQFEPGSNPRLLDLMNRGVNVKERLFGEGYHLRPSFIQHFECTNILIEGISIKRPPMWMVHPALSKNITVRGVKFFSDDGPNGDGCNPECCKNVLIENCLFDTGDDCIAIKSGRNRQGYDLGIPSENIIIRNCKMINGHGGVVIGSELSGGVRNVFVYNCKMESPELIRAIRIKSNKYRGGIVENIFVRDVNVKSVRNAAIKINQNYFSLSTESPVKYTAIRNIFIEKFSCDSAGYALQINGIPEKPIENIVIANSKFSNIADKNVLENVNGLYLDNVFINGKLQNKNLE